MSKRTDKLGFVAPQASEFGQRLTSWKSAVAASDALKAPADQSVEADDTYDAELARVVTAEDAAADALVGTPAETTEQVALKVDAIYRRWVGGASLAEPEIRRQVASWPSNGQQTTTDMAQCLLALYLDLTGLPAAPMPVPAVLRAVHETADVFAPSDPWGRKLFLRNNIVARANDLAMTGPDSVLGVADALCARAAILEDEIDAAPSTDPAVLAAQLRLVLSRWAEGIDTAERAHELMERAAHALGHLPTQEERAGVIDPGAFAARLAAYEVAEAEESEVIRLEREAGREADDGKLTRIQNARLDALWSVMVEPAPDLDALAWKLAQGIDVAHAEYAGESAEDPETISRLLAERAWDGGCLPAVAYQDVLRLAGRHGPVTEAKPDTFEPAAFLADMERDCGAAVDLARDGTPSITLTETPGAAGHIATAAERWGGLSHAHQWAVRDLLQGRGK